jgi:RND family efflux transporter MFP subunit
MYNNRKSFIKAVRKDGYQVWMKPERLALCALCLVFLAACNNQPQTGPNDIETPVSVRELKLSSISKLLNTSGTALAMYSVDLNSEMSGIYKLQANPRTGKPFKLGDTVKKGQLIVRLEDREYENSIRIDTRKLSLEMAEQELGKQKELQEKGGVTASQVKTSEVNVTNARYDLDNATLNLQKMNVIAPFDGVIVSLPHYSADVKVSQGQPMVGIMDYARLFMDINLPESAIEYIQVNQPVNITHYTLPYDTLTGTITELSPAISTETRTFKGKIIIDNREMKLRPGMFVKADVIVDRADSVIVIPKDVILSNRNRRFVYVVERNTAIMRNLTTGIEDEDNIQVLEGLYENDNLIVRGFETLRDNSRVRVLR